MDLVELPVAVEPSEWFVVFHPTSRSRLIALLACGRFKHVSAVGYCAGFKAWLLVNAEWSGLRLQLHHHDPRGAWFADYSRGCDVVRIKRLGQSTGLRSRAGFYCVTAISQLIGLPCGALRPIGLYRQLLRHGGTLIDERLHSDAADRPNSRG